MHRNYINDIAIVGATRVGLNIGSRRTISVVVGREDSIKHYTVTEQTSDTKPFLNSGARARKDYYVIFPSVIL